MDDFISSPTELLEQFKQRQFDEDFIEYQLFVDNPEPAGLEKVAETIKAITADYRESYIWHHDSLKFDVAFPSPREQDVHPHLYGKTRVGGNIDDEWFVTWLLLQATNHPRLKAMGLSAYVTDADGHFLLIEAAETLPDWIRPDNSDYRVWLRGGTFHLINLEQQEGPLTPALALSILADPDVPTSCLRLSQALHPRLTLYPQKIDDQKHTAACLLPLSIAHLLHRHPSLLPAAIRALQSRNSQPTQRHPQRLPLSPFVTARLTFTRYLYGLLEFDETVPSKQLLAALSQTGVSINARACSRGLKLAMAVEKLYWQSRQASQNGTRGEEWERYLQGLRCKGWFAGHAEGSAEYRSQMRQAQEGWRAGAMGDGALWQVMDRLLQEKPSIALYGPADAVTDDEDDSWLEVEGGELENILEKYGQPSEQPNMTQIMEKEEEGSTDGSEPEEGDGEGRFEGGEELAGVARRFRGFLSGRGDLEGAEAEGREDRRDEIMDVERLLSVLKGGRECVRAGSSSDGGEDSSVKGSEEEVDADGDLVEGQTGGVGSAPGHDAGVHERVETDSDDESRGADGDSDEERDMQLYMDEMDRQLQGTTLDQSFERRPVPDASGKKGVESQNSIDVDLNLVKNLLESLSAQAADPGPTSNLFGELRGQ